jgi:NitT/TauT family transport system substrate-binding protein
MMKRIVGLVLVALFVLTGCSSGKPKTTTVRVAVLPVLDTLPMYVADREGLFEKHGIEVEFVQVASAAERDQIVQSSQADAMLNELVTTLFYNKEETRAVIVRFARVATSDYPLFRILAAKDSGIQSVEDLKGVEIGVAEGTVIEYTTDRLLENAGFAPEDIAKIAVPKIPDRLALLASGELKAANLPDPVASLAIQQGASVVIDDTTYPEISNSVISFRAEFLKDNPETVKAFLAAYEDAVELINSDKSRWADLFIELNLVPPPVIGDYQVPDFPTASVPTEAQFKDSLDWAMGKGLLDKEILYSSSVDASYLP